MSSRLLDSLVTTDALAGVFSDAAVLEAMLRFEAALARAQAECGMIPAAAAAAIEQAAAAADLDAEAIARAARASATPSIAMVAALADRARRIDPAAGDLVHRGATSQDVSDTALVLLLLRAQPILAHDHARLADALVRLSDEHAGTVMLGRTLLQPATPITFGLKAAGWYAAIDRSWSRVRRAFEVACVLQFGGAAGTRAALGGRATDVARALASRLHLPLVPPWHTDRDRLGALVTACALYTAAVGKAARDIALLMQAEVGEVSERGGGSSTMPNKHNPSSSIAAIAAATRMPGLAAAFLGGMIQEHERAAGGSQAEPATLAAIVQGTGAAVAALAGAVEGLSVDVDRMRANLDATRGGALAEHAVMLLSTRLGKREAQAHVARALERAHRERRRLADSLADVPAVRSVLSDDELRDLGRPESYLGDAEAIRSELLGRTAAAALD
jgi:3-carboxy-cis,cis-muconate cycloisomerase